MKKVLSLAIIAISIFTFVGCSQNVSEVNVPVKDIITEIETEIENISGLMEVDLKDEEMPEMNKQIIKGFNINLEDIEEGIIKCPMINLQAEEVIILKVVNESKIPEIKEVLENHIENQLKAFENYVPKNYDLVKNHILKTNGKYIMLVISEDGEKAEQIFDSALSSK